MSAIDDILATAKLPEQTVTLCVRGDLLAQHAALTADLKVLGDGEMSLADPRHEIARQIVDLEAEMKATEVAFTFRALGRTAYRALVAAHPGPEGTRFNIDTFSPALIAASCHAPAMTPTQVDRLFDVVNEGAVEVLFMAAYTVNEGLSRVPFSAVASELTQNSPPK